MSGYDLAGRSTIPLLKAGCRVTANIDWSLGPRNTHTLTRARAQDDEKGEGELAEHGVRVFDGQDALGEAAL